MAMSAPPDYSQGRFLLKQHLIEAKTCGHTPTHTLLPLSLTDRWLFLFSTINVLGNSC